MSALRRLAPALRVGAVWAALLTVGGYAVLLVQLLTGPSRWLPDFLPYYVASRIVATGEGARLYDLALQRKLLAQVAGLPPGHFIPLYFYNPPHMAVLMVPLAWLPYGVAYGLWMGLELVSIVAGTALMCRSLGFSPRRATALIVCALAFYPAFVTIAQGQVDGVLLLLWALAFAAWVRGRAATGAWLGGGLLKFQVLGGPLVLMLMRRRWRAMLALAAVGLACAALAAIVIGPGIWSGYAALVVPIATQSSSPFTFAQLTDYSVFGLATHFGMPRVVGLALAALLVIGLAIYVTALSRRRDVEFQLAVVVSLLISPHLGLHDLVLLIIPGLGAVSAVAAESGRRRWAGSLLVALLFALPWLAGINAARWLLPVAMALFGAYLGYAGMRLSSPDAAADSVPGSRASSRSATT